MDTPTEVPAELVDETGTIVVDVACRRCGYNVRGLHYDGRCPECGTVIGLSCYGDLLRFADPGWVETLGRGANLILWGTLVEILAIALAVGIALATGSRALAAAVGFAGGLLAFYGAWLITKPDPSGIGEDKYVTDRKLVRWALFIGLAEPVLNYVKDTIAPSMRVLVLVIIALLLVGLMEAIGEFAKLTYFGKLAARIPDGKLADRARTLRWFLSICIAIVLVGSIALLLFGGALVAPAGGVGPASAPTTGALAPVGVMGGSPVGVAAVACVMFVAGVVLLIVWIMVLVLVNSLRKAFREQAAIARQSWAAAEADPAG